MQNLYETYTINTGQSRPNKGAGVIAAHGPS